MFFSNACSDNHLANHLVMSHLAISSGLVVAVSLPRRCCLASYIHDGSVVTTSRRSQASQVKSPQVYKSSQGQAADMMRQRVKCEKLGVSTEFYETKQNKSRDVQAETTKSEVAERNKTNRNSKQGK